MESLDGKLIYQVFVRNHTNEGTIQGVIKDLDRIKDLGTDILYLMPIHEIGIVERKGTYGSPYAIRDYYSISKDLGTILDLKELIVETHNRNMQIIMDMVFNHTSPDSVITDKHIEYYVMYEGMPNHRIVDWEDVIDLDTERKDTQDYLIEVLKFYQKLGVDGFRFDVAGLIPIEFFARARLALGNDTIFFAESLDPGFIKFLKKNRMHCEEDEDLVPTFDLLYNYNYFSRLDDFLKNRNQDSFRDAMRIINKENVLHMDMLRANCVENHDIDRIASHLNKTQLFNMLALAISMRGAAFIYAGEEYGLKHKPNLFEKDPVEWSLKDEEVCEFVKEMIELKKEFGLIKTQYIEEIGDLFIFKLTLRNGNKERVILINLNEEPVSLKKIIKESYDETLNQALNLKIEEGEIALIEPMIFTFLTE